MTLDNRILFVDAYDSFSNNIIALLEAECGAKMTRVFVDASIPDLEDFVSPFSAIVCGPGPGHPSRLQDVGLFKRIWALSDEKIRPVLGFCLGFQSLAYEFGASVVRLPRPRHGIKTLVTSRSTSIFDGLATFSAVQYHSLHADLGYEHPLSTSEDLWIPSRQCSQLQPLAWDLRSTNEVDLCFHANPSSILMAVKHVTKPFYGIQFHPESICSDATAKKVVANWWQDVLSQSPKLPLEEIKVSQKNEWHKIEILKGSVNSSPRARSESTGSISSERSSAATSVSMQEKTRLTPHSTTLPLANLTVPSICEALRLPKDESIILDSEMRQLPQLGEASIIGIISPDTKRIQFSVGGTNVTIKSGTATERVDLGKHDGSIFSFLKTYMGSFEMQAGDDRVFNGGLMGYVSYEACLETIGIHASSQNDRPDLCFAFVKRSLVIDHKHRLLHIQELLDNRLGNSESSWVSEVSLVFGHLIEESGSQTAMSGLPLSTKILAGALPKESEYKYKIKQCKELIGAGESYELCLTDQTSITLQDTLPVWAMYKTLRRLNPANFGAFVRLGPLTLLSTSPERFMTWSRFEQRSSVTDRKDRLNSVQSATCQFRPMKGTVRKRQEMPDGSIHCISRKEAGAILAAPKEKAENLMILDLIRHDLHGVCRDVSVPGLMVLEDYESVYQLVSVIEGRLEKPFSLGPFDGPSGIDCLAASLPPGSMTGAPKKRSCQLLQEIEKKPRSIYSGILGYIDVRGGGDFSVLIRSMYKWDDECDADSARWNIGAGGAVTTLSTEEGEWEEMLTKLQSTFRLFEPASS